MKKLRMAVLLCLFQTLVMQPTYTYTYLAGDSIKKGGKVLFHIAQIISGVGTFALGLEILGPGHITKRIKVSEGALKITSQEETVLDLKKVPHGVMVMIEGPKDTLKEVGLSNDERRVDKVIFFPLFVFAGGTLLYSGLKGLDDDFRLVERCTKLVKRVRNRK